MKKKMLQKRMIIQQKWAAGSRTEEEDVIQAQTLRTACMTTHCLMRFNTAGAH